MNTCMLSFPRSGSHFVRYIIEFLTGKATAGSNGFHKIKGRDTPLCLREGPEYLNHVSTDSAIAYKSHFPYKLSNIDNLIVILRHPTEAILSHRFRELPEDSHSIFGVVRY